MNRLPYGMIVLVANKIITQIATASELEVGDYRTKFNVFLTACGWTDKEFDKELLKRIDNSWDFKLYN